MTGLIEQPPELVLIRLASLAVHAQEATRPGAHEFDAEAIKALAYDDELTRWLESVDPALLPVKR